MATQEENPLGAKLEACSDVAEDQDRSSWSAGAENSLRPEQGAGDRTARLEVDWKSLTGEVGWRQCSETGGKRQDSGTGRSVTRQQDLGPAARQQD